MSPDQKPGRPDKVRFHYIKSPLFKTVHVDGVIGGKTPSGDLHFAMFCERAAIPQQVDQKLNEDGSLGGVIEDSVVKREGVVRELQVDAVMSPVTAAKVYVWLKKRLDDLGVTVEESDVD